MQQETEKKVCYPTYAQLLKRQELFSFPMWVKFSTDDEIKRGCEPVITVLCFSRPSGYFKLAQYKELLRHKLDASNSNLS